MIVIQSRPAKVSSVGGAFANPMIFVVETDSAWILAKVLRLDGTEINRLKVSSRNGIARVDISECLRPLLRPLMPPNTFVEQPIEAASVAYFCVFEDQFGQTISEAKYPRYAVYSAQSAGKSDFLQYSVV